ncbi:unnamed protein product, partial [Prorocentrum cordatum]
DDLEKTALSITDLSLAEGDQQSGKGNQGSPQFSCATEVSNGDVLQVQQAETIEDDIEKTAMDPAEVKAISAAQYSLEEDGAATQHDDPTELVKYCTEEETHLKKIKEHKEQSPEGEPCAENGSELAAAACRSMAGQRQLRISLGLAALAARPAVATNGNSWQSPT